MGVRGLPTDFAIVRSWSVTLESKVKLAKTQLHRRKLSAAAGADAGRGERLLSGKAPPQ